MVKLHGEVKFVHNLSLPYLSKEGELKINETKYVEEVIQRTLTCLKLAMEIREECVKHVQS